MLRAVSTCWATSMALLHLPIQPPFARTDTPLIHAEKAMKMTLRDPTLTRCEHLQEASQHTTTAPRYSGTATPVGNSLGSDSEKKALRLSLRIVSSDG